MRACALITSLCALLAASSALTFPIAAPGAEGLSVIVGQSGTVEATYQGNSATYSNDLYFGLSIATTTTFVFNNHETPVGTKVSLGSFPPGTELFFRLHVRNTGRDFYTGPAGRNPDNHTHARPHLCRRRQLPGHALHHGQSRPYRLLLADRTGQGRGANELGLAEDTVSVGRL